MTPKHWNCLCTAWKKENDINVLDLPSQSSDANPRKYLDIYKVQVLREEDLNRQTVISTNSTYMEIFVSRLCYKISRKYASEMPSSY